MSQPTDESLDELSQVPLPKLDARPGPAPWLSQAEASTLVATTLRAHRAKGASSVRRVWQMAAGVALFLSLSAGVSAMLLMDTKRQTPARSAVPAPVVVQAANNSVSDGAPTEQPAPEVHEPRTPVAARAPSTPTDLLSRANQLRSQGHWHRAAHSYGQAISFAPRSAAAYAAMIAAGNLYNEKLHEPQRALRLFERALLANPKGALSEEARWGMAQVHRQQKRRKLEVAALRLFLRHHPHSALAPEAQRRLQIR